MTFSHVTQQELRERTAVLAVYSILRRSSVMIHVKHWLLLASVLSLLVTNGAFAQDDVEDVNDDVDIPDKAFLLIRHKIDTVELVQGKNTSVVVEIYNAGNRCSVEYRCSKLQR